MNLTGGNPISAIGLDNYTTKIHSWFRAPKSLKEKVASKGSWDVPGRGDTVTVPDALRKQIADALTGAYFGLCGEILDADLVTLADFDMALELALDMKPAFTMMNQLGTKKALELVQAYSKQHPGFPVPKCIQAHGKDNKPFDVAVVLQRDVERVRILTIRRPKVLNALDQGVFDELARKFAAADRDPAVEAVVLTGHGRKAFVSGADVKFLAKIQGPEEGEATSRASQKALDQVQAAKKPSVCALNGLAFGGGLELALACETRIAKAGLAVLCATPEVNLGIIPGAGGTQRLPRLIGIERGAQMVRTGKPLSSAQALQWGLIQEEVPGDLLTRAVALAHALVQGQKPRRGLRPDPLPQIPASLPAIDLGHLSRKVDEIACKAILKGAGMKLADGIAFEAKCFGEVCGTEDFRIGVKNFLENGPRSKAPFVHR
jgi:enoyl-CoA hydratase/carnithine racemase